jgi:hypothetical protein
MPQGEFAELLRRNGFPACSKAAVSLAERPKETGVQFTPEARETAQRLLNSARRPEKRVNPNKTTVWLDDELREWVQTQAYLWDLPVGDVIRRILKEAKDRTWRADVGIGPYEEEKAASGAGTSEAAGAPETSGRQSAVPTGHLHDTPKQEENQA